MCDSMEAVSVVDPSCQRSSHQTPGEHGHPRPEMLILGEFRGLASAWPVPQIMFFRLRLLIHSDQDVLSITDIADRMCFGVPFTRGFDPKRQEVLLSPELG